HPAGGRLRTGLCRTCGQRRGGAAARPQPAPGRARLDLDGPMTAAQGATRAELDFTGKTVLVVGGSSGIGNGVAQAFRARGAAVHVWGTRADAAAYAGEEGCD